MGVQVEIGHIFLQDLPQTWTRTEWGTSHITDHLNDSAIATCFIPLLAELFFFGRCFPFSKCLASVPYNASHSLWLGEHVTLSEQNAVSYMNMCTQC